jgi:hypothetical protein
MSAIGRVFALAPRMLLSTNSAFTRVFDGLWLATRCAAKPGRILLTI